MTRNIIVPIIIVALSWACSNQTKKQNVEQWDVYEITMNGPLTGNPFMEAELAAVFTNKNESISLFGNVIPGGLGEALNEFAVWNYFTKDSRIHFRHRSATRRHLQRLFLRSLKSKHPAVIPHPPLRMRNPIK